MKQEEGRKIRSFEKEKGTQKTYKKPISLLKNASVKLPKIPGIVYKKSFFENPVVIGSLLLFMIFLNRFELFETILFSAIFSIYLFFYFVGPKKPSKIYIDLHCVYLTFGHGLTQSDRLENYYLHVGANPIPRGHSGYTYSISLKSKENAKFGKRQLSKQLSLTNLILLKSNILDPVQAKKYVSAFQKQIQTPLELLFQDEKIFEEYETGYFINIK